MRFLRCFFVIRPTVLPAFFVAAALSGCASTMKCGDARVFDPHRSLFPQLTTFGMSRAGYSVTLPNVSLSKEGMTKFNVSGLPPGSYDYRFWITSGAIHGERAHAFSAPIPVDLANTTVSFRATTPDGKSLFNREVRLADLRWTLSQTRLDSVKQLPAVKASSYHLVITVRHPSSLPGVTMHIDGFGGDTNDGLISVQLPSL